MDSQKSKYNVRNVSGKFVKADGSFSKRVPASPVSLPAVSLTVKENDLNVVVEEFDLSKPKSGTSKSLDSVQSATSSSSRHKSSQSRHKSSSSKSTSKPEVKKSSHKKQTPTSVSKGSGDKSTGYPLPSPVTLSVASVQVDNLSAPKIQPEDDPDVFDPLDVKDAGAHMPMSSPNGRERLVHREKGNARRSLHSVGKDSLRDLGSHPGRAHSQCSTGNESELGSVK